MEEENLTCVLEKAQKFVWEKRAIPEPGKNEVLIRVLSVGICGSDLHYWWRGRTARFIVESPLVLGHETAGEVVKCGKEVKTLKEGDNVALEPGIPCRKCQICKVGKYNVCEEMRFHATPPVDGTLAQYVVHPEDFCFRLPPTLSSEEGALVEPLAVAVHSCRRADVTQGSKVLITGAGPIGQVGIIAARSLGATNICVTDINEGRLAFARELGASGTVNVTNLSTDATVDRVLEAMGGEPPNAALECSGVDSSLVLAIKVGAPGCKIVTVGRGSQEPVLPVPLMICKEIEIRGIFRYSNCYQAALDLISTSSVDAKRLISHRFEFKDTEKAFLEARTGVPIKVMINVGGEKIEN